MPAPAPPARSRAKLLARHGRASPALVCPLVLGQAAEIEALPMQWFLTDATKLANGLRALHGALGNDVIVTAAADGLAARAAGGAARTLAHRPRGAGAVRRHAAGARQGLPGGRGEPAAGGGGRGAAGGVWRQLALRGHPAPLWSPRSARCAGGSPSPGRRSGC